MKLFFFSVGGGYFSDSYHLFFREDMEDVLAFVNETVTTHVLKQTGFYLQNIQF